jgi:hypothetical protein
MHTGTYPGMKDHISHIKRKTEVTVQHNDMKPCSLEMLILYLVAGNNNQCQQNEIG